MRRVIKLPKTNVKALERDILVQGSEAGLPRNLSDLLLAQLERDLMYSRVVSDQQFRTDPLARDVGPLMVVKMLLKEKRRSIGRDPVLDIGEVVMLLSKFEEAIIEEIICRQIGIFFDESPLDIALDTLSN